EMNVANDNATHTTENSDIVDTVHDFNVDTSGELVPMSYLDIHQKVHQYNTQNGIVDFISDVNIHIDNVSPLALLLSERYDDTSTQEFQSQLFIHTTDFSPEERALRCPNCNYVNYRI